MSKTIICLVLLILCLESQAEPVASGQDGLLMNADLESLESEVEEIDLAEIDRLLEEIDSMEMDLSGEQPESMAKGHQSRSKPTGAAVYYVVVGSFRNLENALALKSRLQVPGYEVSIADLLINANPHHRVLVGPVPAGSRVDLFAQVREQGIESPWMISRVAPRAIAQPDGAPGDGAIRTPQLRPLKVPSIPPEAAGEARGFNFATLKETPVRWRDPRTGPKQINQSPQ